MKYLVNAAFSNYTVNLPSRLNKFEVTEYKTQDNLVIYSNDVYIYHALTKDGALHSQQNGDYKSYYIIYKDIVINAQLRTLQELTNDVLGKYLDSGLLSWESDSVQLNEKRESFLAERENRRKEEDTQRAKEAEEHKKYLAQKENEELEKNINNLKNGLRIDVERLVVVLKHFNLWDCLTMQTKGIFSNGKVDTVGFKNYLPKVKYKIKSDSFWNVMRELEQIINS